jgi:hypothetical protein
MKDAGLLVIDPDDGMMVMASHGLTLVLAGWNVRWPATSVVFRAAVI